MKSTKLILILVMSTLICAGCGNKEESIQNINGNNILSEEVEIEIEESILNNDLKLDNMDIIKISKEDVLKQYQKWICTDYSYLHEELINPFYPIVDIEIMPDMLYQVDFNNDNVYEEVYVKNGKMYVNGRICADTQGLRCSITDLDRNDKRLEIVFTGQAPISTYMFWTYDGMKMQNMLEILDAQMDGYGAVVSSLGQKIIDTGSVEHEVAGEFCYYKLIENGLEKQNIDPIYCAYTDNLVFINSLEMCENDYLLKGSLYKKMTIAKDEVEFKLKNKQPIAIGGEQYTIVNVHEDNTHFELQTANGVGHYNLWLNDNDSYDVISTTEFSDVWELSKDIVEIRVSKDARIVPYYEEFGDMKIQEYYLENKGLIKQAENSTNPANVYSNFVIKNGKCIRFSVHPTGH